MIHAQLRSQAESYLRSGRRGASSHPADRALRDLLARLSTSIRTPLQTSAHSPVREASSRLEREATRCACGGTCPKCQGKARDDVDELRRSKHEAEADGMDAIRGMAQIGRANDFAAAAGSVTEDDPVVEYSNGTTSCNRDTGTMTTVINNSKCTRPCTEEHEADHRAYRGDCCRAYAAARTAAIDAGDTTRRNALTRRYNDWISATSDYSECRAYRVSVSCGERMERELGCSTLTDENRDCCGDVRSYLTTMRASRDSRCPGTDQDCPDFSA